MRFASVVVAAVAVVAPFVFGAVVPAERGLSTLEPRGGDEIIYIANCKRTGAKGQWYDASYAPWYSNWRNSQNGQPPESLTNEYRDWSKGGSTITFEGQEQVFTYPSSGVKLYIHIQSNGLDVGNRNYAGYIDRQIGNSWSRFTCLRDNGRELFHSVQVADPKTTEFAWLTCDHSLYYCYPN